MKNRELKQMPGVFGITEKGLLVAKALTNETEDVLDRQKEAQEAALRRDSAFGSCPKGYSDFITIACIALEDKPQYMKILGIVKNKFFQCSY